MQGHSEIFLASLHFSDRREYFSFHSFRLKYKKVLTDLSSKAYVNVKSNTPISRMELKLNSKKCCTLGKYDYNLFQVFSSNENLFGRIETPFASQKIVMWCALSRQRVFGPFFFQLELHPKNLLLWLSSKHYLNRMNLSAGFSRIMRDPI